MTLPEFHSALDYTKVRDFGYPEFHPLFYGVAQPASPESAHSVEDENGWEVPTQRFDLTELEKGSQNDEVPDSNSNASEPVYSSPDDIYSRAIALFDFAPENDNEISLTEGQLVWVSYRHGQGWLVAENLETHEAGLIPEEYVQLLPADEDEWVDVPQAERNTHSPQNDTITTEHASELLKSNTDDIHLSDPRKPTSDPEHPDIALDALSISPKRA